MLRAPEIFIKKSGANSADDREVGVEAAVAGAESPEKSFGTFFLSATLACSIGTF
jgi:hypothetical protein